MNTTDPNRPGPWQGLSLCTHCGYCLPACPTYQAKNDESLSPRGRISILLALHTGQLDPTRIGNALDTCLLCNACHSACPAGVQPGKLILLTRANSPLPTPFLLELLHRITDRAWLTTLASGLIRLYRGVGLMTLIRRKGILTRFPQLAAMEALLPSPQPSPRRGRTTSKQGGRGRIGLLPGCIGRLTIPGIRQDSAALLTALGYQVIELTGFGCCGAPHREHGNRERFRQQAKKTLAAFQAAGPLNAVVCDSSICAVTLRAYGKALEDDPELAARAKELASKSRELAAFLADDPVFQELALGNPGGGLTAFHHHCQTVHSLAILSQSSYVFAKVPVATTTLTDPGRCCGAGGDYLLRWPEISGEVRTQRLAAIQASQAETIVTGNPGCLLNLTAGLEASSSTVRVRHLAQWLSDAIHHATSHQNINGGT